MQQNDPRTQAVEKNLFAKLTSLGNEEIDEMERLRKKFNVMEVKIDDIYNHLLASKTIDPRKSIIDKLNLVSATLMTVGILILALEIWVVCSSDFTMMIIFVSFLISVFGLALLYISIYLQSSRGRKDSSKRGN